MAPKKQTSWGNMENTIASGINVLVGTPAYNGMVHIDYLNSILEFHKEGLSTAVMAIGNESLITRGRNTIISYFHDLKQFTHLLFLDGDIYLSGKDLVKLLSHKKDVIGAAVSLKGHSGNKDSVYNVGDNLGEEGDLVKTDRLGTAVFILSRKAVEDLIQDADIYNSNPHTRGINTGLLMFDVFKTAVYEGNYLSEDYYVCKSLLDLGYEIWVDQSVRTRHNGMYVFT